MINYAQVLMQEMKMFIMQNYQSIIFVIKMKLIGRGNITAVAGPTTQIALDNCGLFTKYFTKNDGTTIDDAEY